MRRAAAWLLLLPAMLSAQDGGPAAEQRHFQYERAVTTSEGTGTACAVLDAAVFAHAAPALKDVRLYRGQTEVPFAMTLSQTTEVSDPARILNLGEREGKIVFDLQMPSRSYSEVVLDLEGKDFLATADVAGAQSAGGSLTRITQATLFDLSSQHLGRSMVVQVGEASFPVLHFEVSVRGADGGGAFGAEMVRGASVPPNREAQTVYTAVASAAPAQRGRESVAVFHVPAEVPVERVTFAAPKGRSFSRDVVVKAWAPSTSSGQAMGQTEKDAETVTGTVSQVRVPGSDAWVRELSVPATLGANLQRAATVEVAVQNGDDAPVPFSGVQLEMRQRKICFEGGGAMMFYGDPVLRSPVYDFARLFDGNGAREATLGPEQRNPAFVPRADERPYSERHPELLWVVLLGVVCLLGVVALRSMKRVQG
jgi:hypothetical protein